VLYARQPLEGLAAHLEGHPALKELRLDAATLDTSENIAAKGAKYSAEIGFAAEGRVSSSIQTASAAIALVAEAAKGRRCFSIVTVWPESMSYLYDE
jgi:hypothetical protein